MLRKNEEYRHKRRGNKKLHRLSIAADFIMSRVEIFHLVCVLKSLALRLIKKCKDSFLGLLYFWN